LRRGCLFATNPTCVISPSSIIIFANFVLCDIRFKDAVDQHQNGSVVDPALYALHEDVMVHTVEKFLYILVHGPAVTRTRILLCLKDR